jgi:hypothetical protein
MVIDRIKKLRGEGYSYGEISKIVDKSKKFIWKNSKDIGFSKNGEKRYHKEVKGIIKLIKPQTNFLSAPKIRIIGHVLFDGMLSKSKEYHKITRYINSSKENIDQFISDVMEVYDLKPTALEVEKGLTFPIYKVSFSSKLMYEDLSKYIYSYSTANKIALPDVVLNSSQELKLEFLKTFFDDEGSISRNGRIMADLKSKAIISQIVMILEEFGLKFKQVSYKDYKGETYKVYLPKTKENLELFFKLRLFDKAIVTHGTNAGRKKIDVLKEACAKLKNP